MKIKDSRTLKGLQTQLSKIEGEISALETQRRNLDKEVNQKKSIKQSLQAQIKNLESSDKLIVSEHATLRYIERVMGIDIEKLNNKILTDSVSTAYSSMGNGSYPIEGGHVVVKNGKIVTIK